MTERAQVSWQRHATIGIAYVVGYVALDWASYIHPVANLTITPWNPPPGLSLFLLLRYGLRYAPLLFVAALGGDLAVRGVPSQPSLMIGSSLLLAVSYFAVGALLAGPFGIGRRLRGLRDVNRFVITVGIAPLLIGIVYVGLYVAFGGLAPGAALDAVLQFWIGDAIGIVVTTPLLLEFFERRPVPRPRVDIELCMQAAAVLLALWIVFGVKATDEFKFFYLLFLPLIWIAMRRGLRGAVVASLAIQLGLIAAAETIATKGILLRELQFVMMTLALTALYLGMAVSEREAAQRAVAARDAALNRALRMATAGELAAAIAHEVNQPLSAIGTFARACVHMIDHPPVGPPLRDALDRIGREVKRASEVIRRLREFYRTGAARRERIAPDTLIDATVESMALRLAQRHILLDVERTGDLPAIEVDRVQMQAVLHNLLANAVDALAGSAVAEPRIAVRMRRRDADALELEIVDNGPGISAEIADRLFQPFTSTKSDGMGLGLAMSRSIVEAHGGTLELAQSAAGPKDRETVFKLTLPFAKAHDYANDA